MGLRQMLTVSFFFCLLMISAGIAYAMLSSKAEPGIVVGLIGFFGAAASVAIRADME